ncbi:glycosyltransferase family 4 protein [Geomonas oryzisoli]|uniref:Glycosyltransferase family 4 protein n=1 Tax=Geomonas oryzisoli TaxID=2847992 RepID=A0ABX8J8M8_9BACT|nr:glycosyltransferase family 4 protein [Geomonas oryzisoli]QWV94804.1 glycosyltransferase family 4 protein [Geomonas oryzisoli]
MQPVKLLFVSNTSYYLYNFRRGLLTALRERGYDVVVAAPQDGYSEKIAALGFQFLPIRHLDRKGMNPVKDLRLMLELYGLYRDARPDVVFTFTIKPNIYGGFAAALAGVKAVSTATGLGHSFSRKGILNSIVRGLYRLSSAGNENVVFQNQDDMDLFVSGRLVSAGKALRSPGSGVDLSHFTCSGKPAGPPRFILVSRMLREKGVLEFAAAAAMVRKEHPEVTFCLLGPIDKGNPSAVTREELEAFEKSGDVMYLGETEDVRPFIEGASAVVLPSVYREGVPKILLESMAMGKPIITTDSVGCKETIDDGRNGYLLENNSPGCIADAVKKFLTLSEEGRHAMGQASREKARSEFDERIVIALYGNIVAEIVKNSRLFTAEAEVV